MIYANQNLKQLTHQELLAARAGLMPATYFPPKDKIMTKVSIETIGGKLRTVIRKPFDADWVKEQLSMEQTVLTQNAIGALKTLWNYNHEGMFVSPLGTSFHPDEFEYTITILPALPRKPKPEDAALLYRYWSEGLAVRGVVKDIVYDEGEEQAMITHAILNYERVEIAIKGE